MSSVHVASAELFDGTRAQGQPASIAFDGQRVIADSSASGLLLNAHISQLRVVTEEEGRGLRLIFPTDPAARVVVEDTAFLDALRAAGLHDHESFADRSKRFGIFAASAVIAFFAVFGISETITPQLANVVVATIPEPMEKRINRRIRRELLRTAAVSTGLDRLPSECSRPSGQAALRKLAVRLEQAGGPKDLKITVVEAEMANAFALPGNEIVVFSGLFELIESPGELAGVIAHEAGHIAYRHPMQQMLIIGTRQIMQTFGTGSVRGVEVYGQVASALLDTRHSREAERVADAYALRLLEEAGLSARPFAELLSRFASAAGDAERGRSWVLTHPSSKERAAWVRANRNTVEGDPALTEAEFRAVRGICKTSLRQFQNVINRPPRRERPED